MSVAVVTGAASGMGRASVDRLVARGWRVAAVDLPGDALDAVGAVSGVEAFACDVADVEAVRASYARVVDELGAVDRLVHAAGIARAGAVGELDPGVFEHVVRVNYVGTVNWVSTVLSDMRERGSGDLVLFASIAGWVAVPRMAAYTASKFAVVGLAETLKLELVGTGVRLRCVCPPSVDTPMLEDIHRQGMPREAGEIVRPVSIDLVLDAVDRSLARRRGRTLVFPGMATRAAWRARRFVPPLVDAGSRRLVR